MSEDEEINYKSNPGEIIRDIAREYANENGLTVDEEAFKEVIDYLNEEVSNESL